MNREKFEKYSIEAQRQGVEVMPEVMFLKVQDKPVDELVEMTKQYHSYTTFIRGDK